MATKRKRMADISFSCPGYGASFLPSITPRCLVCFQRATIVRRKAMSVCTRPGLRKRCPAILTLPVNRVFMVLRGARLREALSERYITLGSPHEKVALLNFLKKLPHDSVKAG